MNKNELVGFEKDGITYHWCKECPKKSEKFLSTKKVISPDSGEELYATFNGVKWALDNGYTPIYKQ